VAGGMGGVGKWLVVTLGPAETKKFREGKVTLSRTLGRKKNPAAVIALENLAFGSTGQHRMCNNQYKMRDDRGGEGPRSKIVNGLFPV